MAILNYASQLSEVLQHLNVTNIKNTSAANLPKLFFTGEGDIITHGINYLPLFNASTTGKGLVPSNTSGNVKQILRGNATWAELTTADLPMWSTGNYTNNQLLTALQIQQLFDSRLAANDAMIFKGVVASQDDVTSPWSVGDTYRVSATGQTFFGQKAEIGDLLICTKDGKNTDENINTHWTVIQTNIEGKTTISVNNAALSVYAGNSTIIGKTYSIYGPTTGGIANDNAVLIGSKSATGTPTWATLAGLTINNNKLTLLTASTSVLGGVKIDSNSGLNNKPTISINTDGTIYLTKENIINALRYTPADSATLQDALSLATRDKNGLTPKFDTLITNSSFATNTWLLGVTKGTDSDAFGWYSIPSTAFSDTWRKIMIGGIDIEDSELHINPSGDVCVDVDKDPTDNVVSISFGLSWWNISANNGQGAYETA